MTSEDISYDIEFLKYRYGFDFIDENEDSIDEGIGLTARVSIKNITTEFLQKGGNNLYLYFGGSLTANDFESYGPKNNWGLGGIKEGFYFPIEIDFNSTEYQKDFVIGSTSIDYKTK